MSSRTGDDRRRGRWRGGRLDPADAGRRRHHRAGSRARRASSAASPHDGPCRVLVESELVGAAQAALIDEDEAEATISTTDRRRQHAAGDLRSHGRALRRVARARGAARRAVRVHGRGGTRRRDAAARRRLRHGLADRGGGRAPGREGVGRRRLRADAREGARAARARRGVQARAGRRPAVPQGLVRRGDDAPRRAHARRSPAARAGRGAARARARGSPVRLDVRARALHGPSPAPVPARPPHDRPRALPVGRAARRASWPDAGLRRRAAA